MATRKRQALKTAAEVNGAIADMVEALERLSACILNGQQDEAFGAAWSTFRLSGKLIVTTGDWDGKPPKTRRPRTRRSAPTVFTCPANNLAK